MRDLCAHSKTFVHTEQLSANLALIFTVTNTNTYAPIEGYTIFPVVITGKSINAHQLLSFEISLDSFVFLVSCCLPHAGIQLYLVKGGN